MTGERDEAGPRTEDGGRGKNRTEDGVKGRERLWEGKRCLGGLFRDHKLAAHILMPLAAEDVTVKFKSSHLIRGEGNSGGLARPNVTPNLKGGTVEAMQSIQGGEFQDYRDPLF